MESKYDTLLQKFLKGKSSRIEEKELIDILLKSYNALLVELKNYKKYRLRFDEL